MEAGLSGQSGANAVQRVIMGLRLALVHAPTLSPNTEGTTVMESRSSTGTASSSTVLWTVYGCLGRNGASAVSNVEMGLSSALEKKWWSGMEAGRVTG